MGEPPPPLFSQLGVLFAVAADLGFILLLWFSSAPMVIKLGATGVLFLFAHGIVFFYLGRRYEWNKSIRVRNKS
jgi:hypothetical protein